MQAGENLCSLKSRNNCIMRRKIFDIYKALRHFNVTAEEANEIAQGYQYWLTNQVESLPPYNTVYFCPLDDKLYSMPYPKKSLESLFVGIEIGGVVYPADCFEYTCDYELEIDKETLKAKIAKKFKTIDKFKLRMPTKDEAKILVEKTYDVASLNFVIGNDLGDVWITPDHEHPDFTVANVITNDAIPHLPVEAFPATLYFVICPDDKQIFYGKVDKYGTPTKDTMSIYHQLYDRLY